jgi:hypothetical protein
VVITRDPRSEAPLLPRDAQALAFIGRGKEVAQYQLRAAVFPGRTEVVASRRVRRWTEQGLIVSDRLHGFGMNRLRLTEKGRDAVVAAKAATEEELFVPAKPIALKDLAHHLWINDLRVVAGEGLPFPCDRIVPAWLLERTVTPRPKAIPDLLLVQRPKGGSRGRMFALEVDMGGERLVATLLPKLKLLADILTSWAERDVRPGVLVLTRGPKRLASLRASLADADLAFPVAADLLPSTAGGEALGCLRQLLRPPVQTSSQGDREEVVGHETVV